MKLFKNIKNNAVFSTFKFQFGWNHGIGSQSPQDELPHPLIWQRPIDAPNQADTRATTDLITLSRNLAKRSVNTLKNTVKL